jgi:hypothetical protein
MSKKFKYIFPVFALLFLACDSDDDGFYNTVYVQSQELMTIENPSATYNVGDVIQVSANIPRLLDEPGMAEPLDLRETSHADNFQFSFLVEKQNANGEWELFDVTDDYVPGTEGTANVNYYVQGILDFDAVADSYLYNGGVRFDEPGTYRLNFSNNTNYFDKVYFQSNSENNNIVIDIFSASANLNNVGVFQFTVN